MEAYQSSPSGTLEQSKRSAPHKLQEKCNQCGRIIKDVSRLELNGCTIVKYDCGHSVIVKTQVTSDYNTLVFDGSAECQHEWGTGRERTTCVKCEAHKLYDYQIIGAQSLEKHDGRFAIFDDMGLGKTIQALAYMRFNMDKCTPYLWVTKSKIKYQHMWEIMRILGESNTPQVITGSKTYWMPNAKGYVISYDLFRRLELAEITKLGIKCIVLDECQAIKNPDSARTIALRDIVKDIPRIIPLSGTFWKNKGSEAFVALNMLDPKMFWSFANFKRQHVRYITDENGKEKEGGFRNPEKFLDMISHIAIRRERKAVMPELPSISRTKLMCQMDDASMKVYQEEAQKIKDVVNGAIIDGREGSFAVNRAVNDSIIVMRQIIGIAKVPYVLEYVQDFLEDTDRKLIVFVHHIKVGELIYDEMLKWCKENNIPAPIRMLGGSSAEDVKHVQDQFNDSPSRLLIASTLAAGEGLNLQKSCSDILMAERQWNPANEEQAEARVNRIGQSSDTINAVYALASGTVDITLDKLVSFKRHEFHAAMNKGQIVAWNEQSIFKSLVDSIVSGKS